MALKQLIVEFERLHDALIGIYDNASPHPGPRFELAMDACDGRFTPDPRSIMNAAQFGGSLNGEKMLVATKKAWLACQPMGERSVV
jgi:hypothetical protein